MMYTRNDDAVSPVIGVILMVAITVILAAVTAAFTFGMVDQVKPTRIVSATAGQLDGNTIIVTYRGGQDAGSCTRIRWDVTPAGGSKTSYYMIPDSGSILEVGKRLPITGSFTGRDKIVAVATFTEGSEQVILEDLI